MNDYQFFFLFSLICAVLVGIIGALTSKNGGVYRLWWFLVGFGLTIVVSALITGSYLVFIALGKVNPNMPYGGLGPL